MMGGTCVCGASTGCDGQHACPTDSPWKDIQIAALRAALAGMEREAEGFRGALEKIASVAGRLGSREKMDF